jgi:predicted oxidoreductase
METPLVTNQIEMSVLENSSFTNGDLAFLQERNIPPMAWSPLAGGLLFSDENPALLSLLTEIGNGDAASSSVAWLLAHPARIMPILGTNSLSRIKALSRSCSLPMDRETWFKIYTTALGHEVA